MYHITIIDINGRHTDCNLETSQLLERFPVLEKYDFRVIDERYDLSVSDIRVKQNILIFKMDFIRMIIDVDKVYIFMTSVEKVNNLVCGFIQSLKEHIRTNGSGKPMEIMVLEEAFKSIYEHYDSLVDILTPKVIEISQSISANKFTSNLKHSIISVQTKHIDLQTKIKDIAENLSEMASEWEKEEIAELNITSKISKEEEELLEKKKKIPRQRHMSYFQVDEEALENIIKPIVLNPYIGIDPSLLENGFDLPEQIKKTMTRNYDCKEDVYEDRDPLPPLSEYYVKRSRKKYAEADFDQNDIKRKKSLQTENSNALENREEYSTEDDKENEENENNNNSEHNQKKLTAEDFENYELIDTKFVVDGKENTSIQENYKIEKEKDIEIKNIVTKKGKKDKKRIKFKSIRTPKRQRQNERERLSKSDSNVKNYFNAQLNGRNTVNTEDGSHECGNDSTDSANIMSDTDMIMSLIDTYKKYFEDIDDQMEVLKNKLDVQLKIININLSEKRNLIAMYDIKLTIFTLAITTATFVSSSFGMNLKNHIEDYAYPFVIVNGIMLVLIFIIFIVLDRKFSNILK